MGRGHVRRGPASGGLIALLGVLLACLAAYGASPAAARPAASAGSAAAGSGAKVVRVVTAAGQRQHIDCRGTGGPTVVLVSGLWGSSRDWADQVGAWRRGGRVCAYDRPGLGASSPRRGIAQVDAGTHANELRALLRAAEEKGPFILVGHSYGGLISRAFMARYPKAVRGLLLLDAVPPGLETEYAAYGTTFTEAGTTISLPASSRATGYDRPLAGVPAVVLSGENPGWDPEKVRLWNAGQDRAARASGVSIRLIARRASHQLQLTAPAALDKALRKLRSGIRRGTFRAGCHVDWDAVGADCVDLASQ